MQEKPKKQQQCFLCTFSRIVKVSTYVPCTIYSSIVSHIEIIVIYCTQNHLHADGLSKVSLCEVLSFITGTDSIPPLGFDYPISVGFQRDLHLPTVSTCTLYLSLPTHWASYDEFQQRMEFAVQGSAGFGQL